MPLMPSASRFMGTQRGATFLAVAGRRFFARKPGQGSPGSLGGCGRGGGYGESAPLQRRR